MLPATRGVQSESHTADAGEGWCGVTWGALVPPGIDNVKSRGHLVGYIFCLFFVGQRVSENISKLVESVMYVCTYVCTYPCIYVRIYVSMYVCMYPSISSRELQGTGPGSAKLGLRSLLRNG